MRSGWVRTSATEARKIGTDFGVGFLPISKAWMPMNVYDSKFILRPDLPGSSDIEAAMDWVDENIEMLKRDH